MSEDSLSPGEMRAKMIANAKTDLRTQRRGLESTLTALDGLGRHTAPTGVKPFLIGVQVGIQLGEFALEDIDGEIMRYDPEVSDE
jgi:hypothetical protein